MDEDEEMYRLMNEEDDFYMGEPTDEEQANRSQLPQQTDSPATLVGLFLFILFVGILIYFFTL